MRELDNQLREFIRDFLMDVGRSPENLELSQLPGDGSRRVFWRIIPEDCPNRFMAMENTPTDDFSKKENVAYLRIGQHLFQKGLPLPEIHRFDLSNGWFIMEDLGTLSLQDMAQQAQDRKVLYERVVHILFRLQVDGVEDFDVAWCCQTSRYDAYVMRLYESNYFRDAFLTNYLGLRESWSELDGPFDHLAGMASRAGGPFFLHRDFQSRNILVSGDRIGIVDWQGGRLGPLQYDLASLLIDPYVGLSPAEREHLFTCYLELLKGHSLRRVEEFKRYYPYLAIQRNLQILGAFSFLSKVRKKPYFEVYIPPALLSLQLLIDELRDPRLSILLELVHSLVRSMSPS